MWVFSLKINHKLKWILPFTFSLLLIFISCFSFWQVFASQNSYGIIDWSNIHSSEDSESEEEDYIKWFEFNVSYAVLDKTSKLDISSHTSNEDVKLNWIELISYLACKYGNDFSKFKQKDLDTLVEKLQAGQSIEDLTKDMKYYSYYFEGYDAVLHEFIGNYQSEVQNSVSTLNISGNSDSSAISNGSNILDNSNSSDRNIPNVQFEEAYGIKAFHPIAKNYSYGHYDDFGASRSYGYKRLHWGNDLMGSIGAPIIAVESGVVEATRMESIWWLENWYS